MAESSEEEKVPLNIPSTFSTPKFTAIDFSGVSAWKSKIPMRTPSKGESAKKEQENKSP